MKKTLINIKKRLIESLFFALRFIEKKAGLVCITLWLSILIYPNYPALFIFNILIGYICFTHALLSNPNCKPNYQPKKILEITPENPLCTTKESFYEANMIYYKTPSNGYFIFKSRYGKTGPCTEEQLQQEIKLNQ